ncbi:MAG: DUF6488 family protein [Nitrosomonas sp.]|uniref:DUF6488 family protein n=1 Tax=Nitrosomonas sp. TaxID=42353 RepID=UPI0027307E03|nr:DUF6488 family protein [Nitrosomonas sp.]MDP1549058.1 DUF6488 family protein [Nitrosomonas sp.]
MKNLLSITILTATLIFSSGSIAGEASSCHFHGKTQVTEEVVINCAVERKDILIKQGKIDPSWKAIEQDKIELVDGKKGKEWLVTFTDPTVDDKTKEKLYMFFTAPGNFIAANFTGK